MTRSQKKIVSILALIAAALVIGVGYFAFQKYSAFARQNPTSGNGPAEHIWVVTAGDRLDTIATQVYGDATRWRQIAKRNQIEDPFSLQPGRELKIPLE